jgi:hypothetical protein
MKLELKHLAPYLPYGLKGYAYSEDGYYETIEEGELVRIDTGITRSGDTQEKWLVVDDMEVPIHEFEPILRPLSDLQNKDLDLWIDFGIEIDETNTHYLIEALVKGTFYAKDIHFAFRVREALFKMHFDVFGLIEKGLAIDINTLKL